MVTNDHLALRYDPEVLKEELTRDILMVTFKKTNGELRTMRCTKNYLVIPKESHPNMGKGNSNYKYTPNPEVCPVFDLDAQGWRSFRFDAVEKVNFLEEGPGTRPPVQTTVEWLTDEL